jgi:hypothetical protein
MSDIKEVKVSLMPADEKKLARTTSRKRRVKGGALESADIKADKGADLAEGIYPPTVVIPGAPAAVPAIDTRGQSWLPNADNLKTLPNVEKQVTPAYGPTATDVKVDVGAPMTGGGVKLGGKKNSLPTAVSTVPGAPRILATKRKSGSAPAILATRKKARLVISTPPKSAAPAISAKTRKFRERSISITVRPSARAASRRMKEKLNALPIAQVRRALLRKGVLKPGSSKMPEPMMRAMLLDYMLLHNAD